MNYQTINTAGQLTAVITRSISTVDLPQIAKSIMEANPLIEQVGYLQGQKFQMMGGELSINGLIAGAYLLGKAGFINDYSFTILGNLVTLYLPKNIIVNQQGNIVTLQGITYQVIAKLPTSRLISSYTRKMLGKLSQNSPAAGIIYYQDEQILPLIYVPATESYIWENACGSGSLAFSLITKIKRVIQPSMDTIQFQILKNRIAVTTTAKEI